MEKRYKVRECQHTDKATVRELGESTLKSSPKTEVIDEIVRGLGRTDNPEDISKRNVCNGTCMIAETEDNKPIGFMLTKRDGDNLRLWSLGVLEGYRQQGVATTLFVGSLQSMADCLFETVKCRVRKGNTAGRSLYCDFGMEEKGVQEHYYHDNEDAIIMEKNPQSLLSGVRRVRSRQIRQSLVDEFGLVGSQEK